MGFQTGLALAQEGLNNLCPRRRVHSHLSSSCERLSVRVLIGLRLAGQRMEAPKSNGNPLLNGERITSTARVVCGPIHVPVVSKSM